MSDSQKVVTRFAPSPTGNLHSGAYRTAIFSYLYARKHGGVFVLRIEDTDKDRSKKEYEDNILESLKWLGLEYDKFFRQSENIERHRNLLKEIIEKGHAYISKEEAKDGSGLIKEIVRFKNPNIDVSFKDEIKGNVMMNTTDLGDFVIAKNINEPLFHFAVVVDDFDEGVTHVIRGEDHVSNTPRQILIQRAIGAPTPIYAHLPLVLGVDKQKLSKRKGALAITEYRDLGYLPEAILNMVSMVGWNPGTERELFSKEDLTKEFDLAKVQKSPAAFNVEKLNWFNREYMYTVFTMEDFIFLAKKYFIKNNISFPVIELVLDNILIYIYRERRITKLSEIIVSISNNKSLSQDIGCFIYDPNFLNKKLFVYKKILNEKNKYEKISFILNNFLTYLNTLDNNYWNWDNYEKIKELVYDFTSSLEDKTNALHPLRIALSGLKSSPTPFDIMIVLGKERTLKRIKRAISYVESDNEQSYASSIGNTTTFLEKK